MTQQQYIINRKLNIVELAQTLGNISEACRNLGVSRQHYYDIKSAISEDGLEGLLEKSRRAPRISIRDDGRPMFAYKWHEKLLPRITTAFQNFEDRKKFDYRTGFAEDVIPTLKRSYQLITDVFGAYFYSVDRIGLIEEYYNSLAQDGEAFVVTFAEDRHIFSNPPKIVKYGPISKIAGSDKSFEEELIARYPTIFSFNVVDDRQALVRSLHIRKDPMISKLDLRALYAVVESCVDMTLSVDCFS